MKRLRLFIILFCIAVSFPLAYVVWHTFQGLAKEEQAQMAFFTESLFDEMERELAQIVEQEENRAVDEYLNTLASSEPSPLASEPDADYILGYLQNNPDGSFQTPIVEDLESIPQQYKGLVSELKNVNQIFNSKKFSIAKRRESAKPIPAAAPVLEKVEKEKISFADRYLSQPKKQAPKEYLGRKSLRTEEITAGQAMNLAQEDQTVASSRSVQEGAPLSEDKETPSSISNWTLSPDSLDEAGKDIHQEIPSDRFQVEVAPLQSVFIDDDLLFIFRRIAVNNKIYRQGVVLKIRQFLRMLAATHFENQPMAKFTTLKLQIVKNGYKKDLLQTGFQLSRINFSAERTFPAPFDFLSAVVIADSVPASAIRPALNAALVILALFMLVGLFAIYQSARTVVDLSERRSQFVSSVTHELKTPLTNIRMYIEMLEQGIAPTPEREQKYYRILSSESTRLSRLINNVLELAKLEKKQRNFDMREGDLQDVLTEVRAIMAPKIEQEGFTLEIKTSNIPDFFYDREVIVQILINLIENSIKFGRKGIKRLISIDVDCNEKWVRISVSDTGPGIPKYALKKIFDDFYRADNDLTRTTGGTGIGLALVKKFTLAMGGKVMAANNQNAGCTITISLPRTVNLSSKSNPSEHGQSH